MKVNELMDTVGYAMALAKYGVIFNHKKVARIMSKYNLRPEYIKRLMPNSSKRVEENIKPDLIKRNFYSFAPNKIWVTDITYLIFNNKRAYLSTILDLYGDRKVVAYKISKKNNIPLVIDTLNEVIAKTKDVTNLIIHSDQGFQYTSFEYKAICESNGITISMNRRGTPLDDSPMESFHGILKKETLYNNYITSLEEYIAIVEDWIEFYNTKRIKIHPHSGWYFIFGHSPNTTGLRTSAQKIGLPAMQLLLATLKRVVRVKDA